MSPAVASQGYTRRPWRPRRTGTPPTTPPIRRSLSASTERAIWAVAHRLRPDIIRATAGRLNETAVLRRFETLIGVEYEHVNAVAGARQILERLPRSAWAVATSGDRRLVERAFHRPRPPQPHVGVKAAGMTVIAVTTTHGAEELHQSDRVHASLYEVAATVSADLRNLARSLTRDRIQRVWRSVRKGGDTKTSKSRRTLAPPVGSRRGRQTLDRTERAADPGRRTPDRWCYRSSGHPESRGTASSLSCRPTARRSSSSHAW